PAWGAGTRGARCPADVKAALSRKPAAAHSTMPHQGQCPVPPPLVPTMTAVRNVLFVMCDQLRRDFVSCYGASPVPTPNLDRLAARGVRFDHAYVQSGVCGPARM